MRSVKGDLDFIGSKTCEQPDHRVGGVRHHFWLSAFKIRLLSVERCLSTEIQDMVKARLRESRPLATGVKSRNLAFAFSYIYLYFR